MRYLTEAGPEAEMIVLRGLALIAYGKSRGWTAPRVFEALMSAIQIMHMQAKPEIRTEMENLLRTMMVEIYKPDKPEGPGP